MKMPRLTLDPEIKRQYVQYFNLLSHSSLEDEDAQWAEALLLITGRVVQDYTHPPLPLMGEEIPSAREVVAAHLCYYTGFMSHILSSLSTEVSIEHVDQTLQAHRQVSLKGGWSVFWSGVQGVSVLLAGMRRVKAIDPLIPWQAQTVVTSMKEMSLFEWYSEMCSLGNLFTKLASEIHDGERFTASLNEAPGRPMIYHSSGRVILEEKGDVFPMRVFSDEEISLIVHMGGDLYPLLKETYLHFKELVPRIKTLNSLAIQALLYGRKEYLTAPLYALRSIRLISGALPLEYFKHHSEEMAELSDLPLMQMVEEIDTLFNELPSLGGATRH